jgi:hypothetical protein
MMKAVVAQSSRQTMSTSDQKKEEDWISSKLQDDDQLKTVYNQLVALSK